MSDTHKIANAINRIRRENDALLVLIIKPDWGYISTDPRLAPKDAIETIRNEIPAIQAHLEQIRKKA